MNKECAESCNKTEKKHTPLVIDVEPEYADPTDSDVEEDEKLHPHEASPPERGAAGSTGSLRWLSSVCPAQSFWR